MKRQGYFERGVVTGFVWPRLIAPFAGTDVDLGPADCLRYHVKLIQLFCRLFLLS